MNCSTPGFPVLRYLPEFAQTHIHWVGDAIQPSRPLSPPSPPAFSLYQHQSFPMNWLFASGGQSIGASALVLPVNIQGWLPLGLTGLISLQSKGFSRVFSSSTVQKHRFFGAQPSLWALCLSPFSLQTEGTLWMPQDFTGHGGHDGQEEVNLSGSFPAGCGYEIINKWQFP